jgi:hypothetical protein
MHRGGAIPLVTHAPAFVVSHALAQRVVAMDRKQKLLIKVASGTDRGDQSMDRQ